MVSIVERYYNGKNQITYCNVHGKAEFSKTKRPPFRNVLRCRDDGIPFLMTAILSI